MNNNPFLEQMNCSVSFSMKNKEDMKKASGAAPVITELSF